MQHTLTDEEIARVRREPDDAKLGDWIIAARTLSHPTDAAEKLLHERLDVQPEVVASDGTRISRKIEKGSYTVPDPVKFMEAVRVLLTNDEDVAQAVSWKMTRLKDVIAKVFKCHKTGKADTTAEGIFDGKLRPFVEQGERKKLVFQ